MSYTDENNNQLPVITTTISRMYLLLKTGMLYALARMFPYGFLPFRFRNVGLDFPYYIFFRPIIDNLHGIR